jgi:GTPase
MLIDDIQIYISAGKGGDGTVSFNKNLKELGPTGGSGGKGGSIFIEGVSDIGALRKFRFRKDFRAENGKDGRSQFRDGRDGEDLVLKVPVGTVAYREDILIAEITKIGERVVIAKGGRGGRGNFHFRSSTNTSPKESENGKSGEDFDVRFQLKMIADVGFIGLPNVGKSSLLNELTNAKSKVANYPFTTLEPNLGVYYDLIIADIPGLIEGASLGKGLGIKFLKHIERTKVLFHFIAADSTDHVKDYNVVREELQKHSKKLVEKKEYIVISKKDNITEEELVIVKNKFKEDIFTISILEEKSLLPLKKLLNSLIEDKKMVE